MECVKTGRDDVEPEVVRDGVLRCPECGVLLDEETMEELADEAVDR